MPAAKRAIRCFSPRNPRSRQTGLQCLVVPVSARSRSDPFTICRFPRAASPDLRELAGQGVRGQFSIVAIYLYTFISPKVLAAPAARPDPSAHGAVPHEA